MINIQLITATKECKVHEILENLQRQTGRSTQRIMSTLNCFMKNRFADTTTDNIHTDRTVLFFTSSTRQKREIEKNLRRIFTTKIARNISDTEAVSIYHRKIKPQIKVISINMPSKYSNPYLSVFDLCIPITPKHYQHAMSQVCDSPIVGRESICVIPDEE